MVMFSRSSGLDRLYVMCAIDYNVEDARRPAENI